MQIYLATTEFGLGAVTKKKAAAKPKPAPAAVPAEVAPPASDYLPAGSRVEVFLSLTKLPWWSAVIGGIPAVALLTRDNKADAWRKKAREVIANSSEFTDVSAARTTGGGAVVLAATTTIDFSREVHASQRIIQLLQQAGLNPVMDIYKIVRRGKTGQREASIRNTVGPDKPAEGNLLNSLLPSNLFGNNNSNNNNDCGFLCALGLSTPFAIAAAAFVGIILLRR